MALAGASHDGAHEVDAAEAVVTGTGIGLQEPTEAARCACEPIAERPATFVSILTDRWHPSATLLREWRNPCGSQPIDRPVHDPRDVCVAVAEWERREGENRRDRPMHCGP